VAPSTGCYPQPAKDWFELSPCKYDAPADPYVAVLLDQNISGEQCAITTYKALMDATKDKDMVTYNMALTILEQEVEHEEDLQSLREDLDLMVARGSQFPARPRRDSC